MRRGYLPPEHLSQDNVPIAGEAYRHLIRVLRLKVGDSVLLCDGHGLEATATVTRVDKASAEAEIESRQTLPLPPVQLTLFQGLPKNSSWEWILQKVTELGITEIVPMICQHSVPKMDQRSSQKRIQRWQRIADEASKQCERAYFPVVHPPIKWAEALDRSSDTGLLFWARETNQMLWQVLDHRRYHRLSLFVGPEGGFSDQEVRQAREQGLQTVSLGNTILRAETAAIVATALTLSELTRQQAAE